MPWLPREQLLTYEELARFARVCVECGVRGIRLRKGDRVTIYLPRILELPIAMLACAKIGAVHSVVYGGFSVEALHGRIGHADDIVGKIAAGPIAGGPFRLGLGPGGIDVAGFVPGRAIDGQLFYLLGKGHGQHRRPRPARTFGQPYR